MPIDPKNRSLQIQTTLGQDLLLLSAASGQEAISRPFSYRVEILCEDFTLAIDPAKLIGTPATIAVLQSEGTWLYRHGFFDSLQLCGARDEFRVIRGEIVPWLAFLKLATNFRIFQKMSAPDIVKQVLGEFGVTPLQWSVAGTYPTLDYCVQCRETAFDFISRLMEENGIFYFFKHAADGHTMVVGDSNSVFTAAADASAIFTTDKEEPGITSWEHSYTYRTGQWELGDFNISQPTQPLTASETTQSTVPTTNTYDRYSFPGRFIDSTGASAQARVRMVEEETAGHTVNAASRYVSFLPGFKFTLTKHPFDPSEENASYLITSLEWSAVATELQRNFLDTLAGLLSQAWRTDNARTTALGPVGNADPNTRAIATQGFIATIKGLASGGLGAVMGLIPNLLSAGFQRVLQQQAGFQNQFVATPIAQAFAPPRITPRPEIRGPHTAVVIGISGMDVSNGDICVDGLGRVRVKFPWDRSTANDSNGETSVWMRVAEGWAGNTWGTMFTPRVGQEVIVEFIDGDPDRPIITGRVYNPVNAPTYFENGSGVPSDLSNPSPQTNLTQSGIRTRSTPAQGKERFHALRFDDKQGSEQLLMRAQGRMDVSSFGPLYETVYDDRHLIVGQPGSDDNSGPFHSYTTVKGEQHLHVTADRYEGVDKGYQLSVTSDTVFNLQGNHTEVVGQTLSLKGMSVVIEGSTKLSLVVGGSFVVISPSGVAITGPMVQINSGGSADSAATASVTAPTDATAAQPGTSGSGATQTLPSGYTPPTYPVPNTTALAVTPVSGGALQVGSAITVDGPPAYQAEVVQALAQIDQTPDGNALIGNLEDTGKQVTIEPPPAPFDPPNATTTPTDPAAASDGSGSDSVIQIDPSQFPSPVDPAQADAATVLAGQLQQAYTNAQGLRDPNP
ncbi:MAG: type VI secretion system tip protein VgrG [Acidisphaera sp.]|nr:type VI secretion system tip protein VgrG [Acidisphaera sp.]